MAKKKQNTVRTTITISETTLKLGQELSIDVFGKENFSAYVSYLINKDAKRKR